jgi:glycine cleavage system H protein
VEEEIRMSIKVGIYDVRDGLLYNREHEWVRLEDGDIAVIGVSDYAAKQLHDIVYVTLPAKGKRVTRMEPIATLESVKAVADVYSPLSGEVAEINQALTERPELVGESPYQDGWIVKLRIEPDRFKEEKMALMSPKEYARYIEELIRKA